MAKKKETQEKVVRPKLIISGSKATLDIVKAVLVTHINPEDIEIMEEY